VLVGVLGGLIGIAFGAGLSQIMAELINRGFGFPSFGEGEHVGRGSPGPGFLNINPVFTPSLVLGSLAFAIAIGTLFGLYPAWRAAKKEPVNALRYE
ncbi:MAG: ABC transporter permease, partial [Candidatus Bathyarchaeia archaeon]